MLIGGKFDGTIQRLLPKLMNAVWLCLANLKGIVNKGKDDVEMLWKGWEGDHGYAWWGIIVYYSIKH